jgi:hypothetical protein
MLTHLMTTQPLSGLGESIARGLATSNITPGGCFITTPLTYPSGTAVIVRIDGASDRFFVSDEGMGYEEALMFNAPAGYATAARTLMEGRGIHFDGRAFYVSDVSLAELIGAVGAIANCSQRAVIETTLRHEARRVDTDRAMLLERLEGAFGRTRVERDVTVRGASNVEWDVTARIAGRDNVVSIFDYARPHRNSVTSTVAKFHDIARLDIPPRRIITVREYAEMGKFIGLLNQAAEVIELVKTPDEALRKLAA